MKQRALFNPLLLVFYFLGIPLIANALAAMVISFIMPLISTPVYAAWALNDTVCDVVLNAVCYLVPALLGVIYAGSRRVFRQPPAKAHPDMRLA